MGVVIARCWLAGAVLLAPLRVEAVSGRVLTDDGLPLPDSAAVHLVCDGGLSGRADLDEAGTFQLPLEREIAHCAVRIAAPGYRTAEVGLEALPADPAIPAAVLYRLGKGDGESLSRSHLAAPQEAVRHYHLAVRELRRGPAADSAAALSALSSAVDAFPQYAQAWFEIGRLRLASGEPSEAAEAFANSIASDPWFVSPYEPLVLLLEALGDRAGVAAACRGWRRINPHLPANCRME